MDKDSPVIHLLLSKTGGVEDEMVTRPRRISALDCPHLLGDDARAGDGGGIIKVECNVRYTALLIKSGRVLFMFVRMLVDLSIAVFYASLIDTYYCDLQLMRNMYVCMYVCMLFSLNTDEINYANKTLSLCMYAGVNSVCLLLRDSVVIVVPVRTHFKSTLVWSQLLNQ